jgi:hypothetical protein
MHTEPLTVTIIVTECGNPVADTISLEVALARIQRHLLAGKTVHVDDLTYHGPGENLVATPHPIP